MWINQFEFAIQITNALFQHYFHYVLNFLQ